MPDAVKEKRKGNKRKTNRIKNYKAYSKEKERGQKREEKEVERKG